MIIRVIIGVITWGGRGSSRDILILRTWLKSFNLNYLFCFSFFYFIYKILFQFLVCTHTCRKKFNFNICFRYCRLWYDILTVHSGRWFLDLPVGGLGERLLPLRKKWLSVSPADRKKGNKKESGKNSEELTRH